MNGYLCDFGGSTRKIVNEKIELVLPKFCFILTTAGAWTTGRPTGPN